MLRRRRPIVLAVVALIALAVFAFGAELARSALAAALDSATGLRFAFDDAKISDDGATLSKIVVDTAAGEPVLRADRAEARYNLHDLVLGGDHRYGLESVEIDRPLVTLIRHSDGSFNVGGASGGGGGSSTTGSASPLRFTALVRDGAIELRDPSRVLKVSRELSFSKISARATVDTGARTAYRIAGAVAGFDDQHFTLAGRVDASGYALHRLMANAIAIAPLVDYVINSHGAEVSRGVAHDVDIRAYAFGDGKHDLGPYHLLGGAHLENGELRIPGLAVSATDMNGRIDVVDDGIATQHMTARLGPVPVRVAGGLYDWNAPEFHLGVVADSSLERVRELFGFSLRLPVAGNAHVETLLESAVGAPLVATSVRAPHATYATFPIDALAGRAIYVNGAVDLVGIAAHYGPLAADVEGAISLGRVAHAQLVVAATGSSDGVPYAAELAPRGRLATVALLEGDGLKIDARGTASGRNPSTTFGGVFHIDPQGEGTFGPIALRGADGADAVGTFYLDRRASESGFWADARGVPFARVTNDPHLPGLALAPPVFGGKLDGSFAGVGPPSNFRIAGLAHASAFEVAGVKIDDLRSQLAGTFANVHLGAIAASGPWGGFRGNGGYLGFAGAKMKQSPLAGTLALTGAYTGSFAKLRTFTGNVAAQGDVSGPVSLLLSPQRTIVQTRDARSATGTVQGVPVDRISGTVAVVSKHVRVYSAEAVVAGGAFAAAGYVDAQRGVGVSVTGVDATRLHRLVPLGQGRIAAIGRLSSRGTTRFDGGLSVGEATFDKLPLGGNGDIALDGTRLAVTSTDAVLGPALGSLTGTLDRLGSKEPRYDLGVHVTALRIAPFASAIAPDRGDIAGTLVGDLAVRGTPATLGVNGTLGIPEGTVNGLNFDGAQLGVAIDPGSLEVKRGTVTVGSTKVDFGARFAGNDASTRVISHAANLADFNDYFDAGDTLGGQGSIDVRFLKRGPSVRTQAELAIAALRYRRFDLGDASARWTSSGRDVRGSIAFGGASGRLETAGTLRLATRSPLDKLLERSRFTGAAKLRGLDLGVWLPALGYQLPVGGRVDADAKIAGQLRDPDVQTTLSLSNGTIGKFPVDRLEVSASSTLRRTTVTRAELDLPNVAVTGSGSFGLGERDKIAFSVHGKSADIGPIAARAFGERLPVEGALEADVKIEGTRAKPSVSGGFDLENATLHGVVVPQALGEVSVSGRDIVLSDAQVDFAKGTLFLAGSVPLEVAPFGFGPAASPITLDFNAKAIDLADFAPLLPATSTLGGELDGHVAVGGTAGNPRLDGSVAVAAGKFSAPFETTPLTGIAGRMSFSGSAATLDQLHANAGGGTLDASGAILFPNLVRPGIDAAYHIDSRAKKFQLDVPGYVNGTVDGTLAVKHDPERAPQLKAALALSDAVIPFSALLLADTGSSSGFDTSAVTAPAIALAPALAAPDVGLALDLTADRNVRVRSANVDIGAHGTLHITGSRSDPVLDGTFASTGGTLSYFNTVFRLLDGTVTFEPELGVIPNLDAHAITHVLNPDPNAVRNVTGSADVTLDVHGPVTGLTIGLSSDPNYDRQQILGLLLSAPALGATTLFGDNRGQATLYGTSSPAVPQTTITGQRTTTGEFSIAQEAFGIANAQFTRTLLAPIETNIADAVGLTNINVNVDYTGNVGLTARKVLGKQVNAIYGTSFGYPYRQTFGFEIKPSNSTAAQVTVFQTLGAYGVDSLTPTTYLNTVNSKITGAQPSQGTTGFSISLQHLFR